MSLTTNFFVTFFIAGTILLVSNFTSSSAFSGDWNSCAYDLDRLRRATRDAADVANDVKSKAEEFDRCKRYPDVYDLMGDRCRSKAWDYQRALRSLETALITVDSHIRSVNSSCGYKLTSIGPPSYSQIITPGPGEHLCDLFRSYKERVPLETLFKICTQSMSEADCKKCLEK